MDWHEADLHRGFVGVKEYVEYVPKAHPVGTAFLSLGPYSFRGPGGTHIRNASGDSISRIFSREELDDALEAAFLFKQTGIPIAAWTRNPVPQDVMSVMAATLWGSLDTMVRTLGGTGPRSAMLEVEDRRMLATLVEPNWTLLLVAPRSVGKRRLRNEAQRLVEQVAHARRQTTAPRATVDMPQ